MKRTVYFLALVGLIALCGCQDKKRLDELESKLSSLEQQNVKNELEKESLRKERDSLQYLNDLRDAEWLCHQNEQLLSVSDEEWLSLLNETTNNRQMQSTPASASQSNLRKLGNVTLYRFDDDNNIEEVIDWMIVPYGEGGVGLYVNQDGGVNSYELHVGRTRYHVSVGVFRLNANNGYFEFSAHAGKYYFDI